MIVDEGFGVVTVTVADSDGGVGDVSVGVVGAVGVAVERVGVVEIGDGEIVRLDVRVPLAAFFPTRIDESASRRCAISIPAVATARRRACRDAALAPT